jgi:periplasmic divalent cation tolerance protein
MKSAKQFSLVLVTVPDLKIGRRLAKAILTKRLAACVNLVPKLESHYWWQGKLEVGAEVLLLIKTSRARLPALEKLVLAEHPYDTPEYLVVPLAHGSERYLGWLKKETGDE